MLMTIEPTIVSIFWAHIPISFKTHDIFLVFVLRSTPNHIPLRESCPKYRYVGVRHFHLWQLQYCNCGNRRWNDKQFQSYPGLSWWSVFGRVLQNGQTSGIRTPATMDLKQHDSIQHCVWQWVRWASLQCHRHRMCSRSRHSPIPCRPLHWNCKLLFFSNLCGP